MLDRDGRPDPRTRFTHAWRALRGHGWTLGAHLHRELRRRGPAAARPVAVDVPDPVHESVRLAGLASRAEGRARGCVVGVHGLGGDATSGYLLELADAAHAAGLDCVRLSLRGADGSGEDLYNAALTVDLAATLASDELAPYDDLYVVGYSLGGHLVLSWATEGERDPRVRSLAAVGAPLDLDAAVAAFDQPARAPYRRYALSNLYPLYEAVARRGRAPLPVEEVRAIRSIRVWDERLVAPRFGYASSEEYYDRASVAPRLGGLALRSLYVGAKHDPMVPAFVVEPTLARAPASLDVRWADDGGHIGFSRALDLGVRAPLGLASQVVGWLVDG